MLIKKPQDVPESEITPENVYHSRRAIVRAGVLAASVAATTWMYRKLNSSGGATATAELPPPLKTYPATTSVATTSPSATTLAATAPAEQPVDEVIAKAFTTDDKRTPFEDITNYNNFYEFSTDKEGVAPAAKGFVTTPWTVEVGGLVRKPRTFDLDEILSLSPPEERVYRMRCVEAWSMVIPWNGFALSKLLNRVEPLSSAKYVAFWTLLDPKRMPNQKREVLPWPYVEGLRMDEAMHPLTILASGIYGRQMPGQNGAPLRLVVPWKYGFKGIKSIVKIELTEKEPPTTWNIVAPREYGFYANVNPSVNHPRWTQATEQRIGEYRRRPTLMFNGYADQVGSLYSGMDLSRSFCERVKDPGFAKFVVLLNGCVPLALLVWDASRGRLGANPVAFALRTTGMVALVFLLLSLAVTPVRKATGWNYLSHFRRMLGLFAFFYGVLHLLTYFVFDRSGSIRGTIADTLNRPFIFAGMTALLLMAPLALTSTNASVKRLGAKRWKALHRLAYVSALAGVLHFYLLVKADVRMPLTFAGVLAVLLLYRIVAAQVSSLKKGAKPQVA